MVSGLNIFAQAATANTVYEDHGTLHSK